MSLIGIESTSQQPLPDSAPPNSEARSAGDVQPRRVRDLWRAVVLPLILYTIAALFITWPLAAQFTAQIAGAGYGDSVEYVRLGWWGKYALQHGLNPFYQSMLGYPGGFFSTTQAAQPLIYWPTTVLDFVFSPVTSFNTWLLLEIILSGLAAYWLCLDVLHNAGNSHGEPARGTAGTVCAALIGGLIFMAFPTAQGHLSAGHVNPLSNYALPVVVLALYRIVDGRGSILTAIMGALAMWILALGNFTFPVYTMLPLVLFGGGYLLLFRRTALLRRAVLRDSVILFGLGLILILPFYFPLLQEIASPNRPAYLREGGWVRYSTDPLSFITPSPFAPWTKAIAPAYSGIVLGTNSAEGTAYLGLVAVGLAIAAVASRRRSAGMWLAIVVGCMIFSLGPLLKWNDQPLTVVAGDYQTHLPMPWALFQNLPGISVTRTPGRFNFTTGLALGVLSALGLQAIFDRLRQGRFLIRPVVSVAVYVILSAAILFEYQLFSPFLSTSAALPPYFADLANRDEVRAVLDIPIDDPLAQKQAMYQQIAHQKPLIAGYVSRMTPVDPAKLAVLSAAALGQVAPNALDNEASQSATGPIDLARAVLKDNGVDVVVYHWGVLDKTATLSWATSAFGAPAYADDQLAIFEIPKPTTDPGDTLAVARPNMGWWHAPTSDWWLTGDATLYVYAPADLDRRWVANFTPLLHARRLQLVVDGQVISGWQTDAAHQQVDLALRLAQGFHTLQFRLPDGCTPVPVAPRCLLDLVGGRTSLAGGDPQPQCALADAGRNLCVGIGLLNGLSVQATGSPESGMGLRTQAVRLSNGMALAGVRFPTQGQSGKSLLVQTEWHADQKLPGDYHVFVHLLDAQGKLAAQADTTPGQGTYPTALWTASQDWIEVLTIDIPPGLTPGKYSLYTGWYSYPDLTRLNVEGDAPHARDGLVYLGDIQID